MPEKIAFITGGNRGLGFQTALELKDQAKVVIGSRDGTRGAEAVKKLRAVGADAADTGGIWKPRNTALRS